MGPPPEATANSAHVSLCPD